MNVFTTSAYDFRCGKGDGRYWVCGSGRSSQKEDCDGDDDDDGNGVHDGDDGTESW